MSAANRTPSSLPWAAAIDVASITQLRSPASIISRNSRWRSIDSGVLSPVGRNQLPTRRSMFVSTPGRRPAASRIERSRNAVVVLPFVPVTAVTGNSAEGSRKKATAATGIA